MLPQPFFQEPSWRPNLGNDHCQEFGFTKGFPGVQNGASGSYNHPPLNTASTSSASTPPFHLILSVMISKHKVSVQTMARAESVGERRSRMRVMISKLNRTSKNKHNCECILKAEVPGSQSSIYLFVGRSVCT